MMDFSPRPIAPAPADNFGTDGDHCPECGADWKRPHWEDCSQFYPCRMPRCESDAQFGRLVCVEHHRQLSELFAPAE